MRGCRKAVGYFYFKGGKATEWIDRTVPTLNSLSQEHWMEEFVRLKKLNAETVRAGGYKGCRARKLTPPEAESSWNLGFQ
jgi:hypothetical protein